jgi:hopanoid biosynthesis associated RND transporter like protein HpnN
MTMPGSWAWLLQRGLVGLVDHCRRHALWVVLAGVVLAGASGLYASRHLGINTDTGQMFEASLPWRQHEMALDRAFPQFQGLLVAVIDADAPEQADSTAQALALALSSDQAHFTMVRRPGASPYLQKEGLLLLSTTQLTDILNRTIDAQPFLGKLVADPTARGLFSTLSLLGQGVTRGDADLAPYHGHLQAFHAAMDAALGGQPKPLSWQRLLNGQLGDLGGQYEFVLARPRLDFSSLQPGGTATQAMRAAAAKLEFVHNGAAHVRITGPVALADAQFATVAQGAVVGLVGSAALITIWLMLAVRSWRLILPILGTLGLGLMLTLLFATAAIGTLNLVSVGFGVLFVGIAVDFAIQFAVRYREARHDLSDPAAALRQTAQRAGGAILVAALATAAGFLAFVPTAFSGVAELGLIAGVGMLIAFLCTLTFLPAAITLCRPACEQAQVGFVWGGGLDALMMRWHSAVLMAFGALVVLAVVLAPRLQFDSDPLHTQSPNTEAMRTLRNLMNAPLTNPYSIDILAANVDQARALAAQLKQLSTVSSVLTIDSFLPQDQTQKLALVADAADILGPTLLAPAATPLVTPAQIRTAARSALDAINPALALLPRDHPLAAIAGDLRQLVVSADQTLLATNSALTRFLPGQLDRFRTALDAQPAGLASVPPDIMRDWVLPDGRARVQVLPGPASRTSQGLHEFVEQVTHVAPDAGGTAVTIEAASATIIGAFRSAAVSAVLAIAVILFVALRRLRDAVLVLAPLLVSAALTVLVIVLLPLPLNFANIIALPLLLGVGVSFNIYFVMNWRAGRREMLASATARAVAFSALTTGTSFGSLALSQHPGTASMGELLLISLGCTLVANLFFVPALLAALSVPTKTTSDSIDGSATEDGH